jgi:hypothetical protein
VNHRFYGRAVTPSELLGGSVQPPRAGRPLYDALEEALAALPKSTYSCLPSSLPGRPDSSSYCTINSSSASSSGKSASRSGKNFPTLLSGRPESGAYSAYEN